MTPSTPVIDPISRSVPYCAVPSVSIRIGALKKLIRIVHSVPREFQPALTIVPLGAADQSAGGGGAATVGVGIVLTQSSRYSSGGIRYFTNAAFTGSRPPNRLNAARVH